MDFLGIFPGWHWRRVYARTVWTMFPTNRRTAQPDRKDHRRAFYARPGSKTGDLITLLHLPYTAWNLAYVAVGAGLSPVLDWAVLAGTLLAFGFGLGIGAHALDELRDRPLRTELSDRQLWWLGVGGLAAGLAVAVAGAVAVSSWVLAWAVLGVGLAAGYSLERPRWIHTELGFGLAWGAFPVLVGYWAQAMTITPVALLGAAAAVLFSLTQRALSQPARRVRRNLEDVQVDGWDQTRLLASWERPLRLLAAAQVVLALALLARHL